MQTITKNSNVEQKTKELFSFEEYISYIIFMYIIQKL